ncbi:MAG: WbqC family protein [Chlorobi bacterium]|nr:WbqC family protein [Chlorobiota bacterium]
MNDKGISVIAPAMYLPPIPLFAPFYNGGKLFIDVSMHFEKRSYINKAFILQANGPLLLIVTTKREGRSRTPLKELKIDYSHNWHIKHFLGISASYRASPFFEFYEDEIRDLIHVKRWETIAELNIALIKWIIEKMALPVEVVIVDSFKKDFPDAQIDLRWHWLPYKKLLNITHPDLPQYIQHFQEITGFVPNLSIIDLLFNMGPHSSEYLEQYWKFALSHEGFMREMYNLVV